MTSSLTKTQQEELFAKNCKVLNLKYEYNDFSGAQNWAIITNTTESELRELYPDIIEQYTPFVLLSVEQGQAIEDYDRNEAKYRMRAIRCGSRFDINDGEFEEHNPEYAHFDDGFDRIEQQETITELHAYIDTLEKLQKSRIIRFYFHGKSYLDIACEDGVSRQAVTKSIRDGIKKLKKFYF